MVKVKEGNYRGYVIGFYHLRPDRLRRLMMTGMLNAKMLPAGRGK